MKKLLLLSWSLVLGFSLLAQQRVAKNDVRQETVSVNQPLFGKEVASESAVQFTPSSAKSVVINRFQDLDEANTMWTTYDLQSNQYCSNRMYQMSNGSVGVAATMSHQYNQTASDRGTGYNFYNSSTWQNQPNNRIEDFKTGWPTIAQWGSNGEILICHGNSHLQCYTRSTAGQGQWVYKGELPDYPAGYPYAGASDAYPKWARVVTSGNNHNIIHVVACIQHSINNDESVFHQVYFRSTDAVNWTVSYGPLASHGYETGHFNFENYCMAANGHNVAILYSGSLTNSVWMFKSTDDGLNWASTKVWEDPYEGISLDDPTLIYADTLYRPMNGAIVIDNNGIVHVALNTFEMAHWAETQAGYYTYWYGRTADGILYWNDTQVAPIQSENGNPHDAARLWWPEENNPGYSTMHNDPTKWIGMVPMFEGYDWNNGNYYMVGSDYISKFYGTSGHPALSCDPYGNLACAFSTPCVKRSSDESPYYYYRSIYVSYRNVNEGYWHQMVDDLTDPDYDPSFSDSENMFTISVPNTVNPGEFWFGFQSDNEIGFYSGSNGQQSSATENNIYVMKVQADPELVGGVVTNYTITATASPTNGGTVTGAGTYASGSTCTLHATANNGYSFVKWTKNGTQVSTNPNYSFTVTANASYVAVFEQTITNYTITASASPTNGGTVTGAGTYAQGSTCTLTATPNEGYAFVAWLKDGNSVSNNSSYSFTVTGNATYIAEFTIINNYTITATADPSNGGTVSGGGTYTEGSTCTLTAFPNNGYIFEKWTKNGTQVSTNPGYSFVVNGNGSYFAHFIPSANHFTVTAIAVPANGGTVSGGGTYEQGTTCTLSATANNSYSFMNWTDSEGNQVSTNANFSFTVDRNVIYLANFEHSINTYNITASANPYNGGTITGAGTYEEGAICTLTATASSGFSFVNWTENGEVVTTEVNYTFTVNRERSLVATFSQGLFYTISAIAGDHGAISPEGDVTVLPGEDKTFTMIPNNGYSVTSVIVDGMDVGPVQSYTIRNVNGNHTIRAQFGGLGVDDNAIPELSVYPNPAQDVLIVEGVSMKHLSIHNLMGVQILSKEIDVNTVNLSLKGVSPGTYILKVTCNDSRISYKKFVVVK